VLASLRALGALKRVLARRALRVPYGLPGCARARGPQSLRSRVCGPRQQRSAAIPVDAVALCGRVAGTFLSDGAAAAVPQRCCSSRSRPTLRLKPHQSYLAIEFGKLKLGYHDLLGEQRTNATRSCSNQRECDASVVSLRRQHHRVSNRQPYLSLRGAPR
jgi:hypothetical protein